MRCVCRAGTAFLAPACDLLRGAVRRVGWGCRYEMCGCILQTTTWEMLSRNWASSMSRSSHTAWRFSLSPTTRQSPHHHPKPPLFAASATHALDTYLAVFHVCAFMKRVYDCMSLHGINGFVRFMEGVLVLNMLMNGCHVFEVLPVSEMYAIHPF